MEPLQTEFDRHEAIRLNAYYLWQERGCPVGSPEVDWLRAEEQLGKESQDNAKPAMVAMAEVMGSALGSVAGMLASVGSLVGSDERS